MCHDCSGVEALKETFGPGVLLLEDCSTARAILGVLILAAVPLLVSGVVSIGLLLFSLICSYSYKSDILKSMRLNFWLNILLSYRPVWIFHIFGSRICQRVQKAWRVGKFVFTIS